CGALILSGLSPFAAAFAAASDGGLSGLCALLGAAVGHRVFGAYLWSLQYISIALMAVAFSVVFRSAEISRSQWFMPVVAGGLALVIGFVSASGGGWSIEEAIAFTTDAVLCMGCTFFYKTAFLPWSGRFNFEDELIHTVSVLILIATALISLSNLVFLNIISVGRTLAVLVVFLAAFKGGAGIGCAAGLAVGLAMDAASGASPVFATAYGMSGLVAGIFSKQSKLLFALSFIIVDAAVAALAIQSGAVPAILYEVFIASVVFIVLPASAIARLGAFLPTRMRGAGAQRAREYTRRRVEQASLAFRELYDTTQTAVDVTRDADNHAVIFDRAADAACRRCANVARCWQEEYNSTFDVMNNLTPFMLKRGKISAADFPKHFSQRCSNIAGFTAAVNYELRAFLYRRQLRNRLEGSRIAAFNQYSEVSDILEGFSSELGSAIKFEPELENKTRKYLQSAGITADVAVFRDRGGRLHAEVSGAELNAFRRDKAWLDRLSVVLGVRLCVPEGHPRSGRLELLEAEPFAATVGVSRMNKQGNEVSGDTGSYFKTDEGVLYILLSDGMGTGEAASRLSSDTVHILERFLRSGVAPDTALRMLNDIMLLRNEEDTECATV
ncbi:MAG: stage II sporulation protein E, partial [Clostridiales bacterium]|nr:stage II sporulation protein E [Clostridiales bacterium]